MARAKLQEAEAYAQNIGDTIRDLLIILDRDLCVKSANRSFYKTFQVCPKETEGRCLHALGDGQWNIAPLLERLRDILPGHSSFDDYEVTRVFPGIGQRTTLLNARKLYRPGNRTALLVLAIEDITARKKAEAQLAGVQQRDKWIASTLQQALLSVPDEKAFPGLEVKMLHEAASDEARLRSDFQDIFACGSGPVALPAEAVLWPCLRKRSCGLCDRRRD